MSEEKKSIATQIWQEIENVPLEIFGIPNQVVSMHLKPLNLEWGQVLLVIPRSSAVLPSLESTFCNKFLFKEEKFQIELLQNGYLQIKYK